jgi:hypothetical protein
VNEAIAGAVGAVLALFSIIGGVSAANGSPNGVSQNSLYSYSDS